MLQGCVRLPFKIGTHFSISAFSSTFSPGSQDATATPISKRKQFRGINPDGKLIAHLDQLQLGYLPKRRLRVALAKKTGERPANIGRHSGKPLPIDFENAPFPFQEPALPMMAAKTIEEVPDFRGEPPEVALIGRSNVGKSTLLNSLVGYDTSYFQKAAVSPRPGQTQALHFFALDSHKRCPKRYGSY